MKSALEMLDTVEKMANALETAQVVEQKIVLEESGESVTYRDLLNRVLALFKKTMAKEALLSHPEKQKVRLIQAHVFKLRDRFDRGCFHKWLECIGEMLCCCSCSYGPLVCKEIAIDRLADRVG